MLFRSNKKETQFITFLPSNEKISIKADQTILESAIESNIYLPHSCGVGSCKSCMVLLESGKVIPLTRPDYVLERDEIEKNYILCCQSLVEEDAVIRILEF